MGSFPLATSVIPDRVHAVLSGGARRHKCLCIYLFIAVEQRMFRTNEEPVSSHLGGYHINDVSERISCAAKHASFANRTARN